MDSCSRGSGICRTQGPSLGFSGWHRSVRGGHGRPRRHVFYLGFWDSCLLLIEVVPGTESIERSSRDGWSQALDGGAGWSIFGRRSLRPALSMFLEKTRFDVLEYSARRSTSITLVTSQPGFGSYNFQMELSPSRLQLRLVGASYAMLAAVSALLIFQRYLVYVRSPQEVAASSGMYAGGDLLLEIFIGFVYLVPTVALL